MGKAKRTPLAQAILLVMNLSDEDKATLRDVLRPERVVSKKVKKVKADPKSPFPICAICGNLDTHDDHKPGYLSSHEFVAPSAGKRSRRPSAAKEPSASSGTSSDDAGSAQAASGD